MSGFRHHAVFVDSEAELCRLMAESALDGLAAGERVVIHTDLDKSEVIAPLLGNEAQAVTFDLADRASSPTAALQALTESTAAHWRVDPAARIRSIGQVRPGWARPYRWMRYEAYVNQLFARHALTGVCFYDTRFISERVRRSVEETHHRIGPTFASSAPAPYRPPKDVVRDLPALTHTPDRSPDTVFPAATELRAVRQAAARIAPSGRAEEAALVIHELVALSLVRGEPAQVRMWSSSRRLVAEIRSRACLALRDPFAGLRPPDRGGEPALWVAGHLADDLVTGEVDGVPSLTVLFNARR